MSYHDQALAEIARTVPGVTAVFHQYRLDFCCGGQQTLRDAASKRGIDADEVVAQITQQLTQDDRSALPNALDTPQLIEHILVRYHDVHREQLPELRRLAQRVERVHGSRSDCPLGLAMLLEEIHDEIEIHMRKEEEVLFPFLSQGAPLTAAIEKMRAEHLEHGEQLQQLTLLTDHFTPPEDACNTWRALYLGLDHFVQDLMMHIHLENNVLFPRFE